MLLSIFTPTYNRAYKLNDIYEGLKKQPSKEYEWLIVDDGSTDETEEVVSQLQKESIIQIKYLKKKNGGKHTAHNTAVDIARGKMFMCLDSDDLLDDNAIGTLIDTIKECTSDEGIIAYKCDLNNKLLSDKFPEVYRVDDTYALGRKYGCRGEFVLIYPTELLKKNKFPVFENEKFLTESVLYDRLKCSMRLLPEIIEVCEYQTDGLTSNLNRIMQNNPTGYCLYFMQRIDMQESIKERMITIGKYLCFKHLSKTKKVTYAGKYSVLVRFCYPLGWVTWLYYKVVRKF